VVLIKMPVGALESPMAVLKAPLTSELGPNGVEKKKKKWQGHCSENRKLSRARERAGP
jgi:hypothetical protein